MKPTTSEPSNFNVSHLEAAVVPETYPRIYQWHKYWGRKSPNMVQEYIRNYCPPSGIVFDPFVGSGVTAIEALRAGRRAIVGDLNPVSKDIISATVTPPNAREFSQVISRIKGLLEDEIRGFYTDKCRMCGRTVEVLATKIDVVNHCAPVEIRHKCSCAKTLISRPVDEKDIRGKRLFEAKMKRKNLWWPTNSLSYSNGESFFTASKYNSYPDLFTKKNLASLSAIWDCIAFSKEWSPSQRDLLGCLFRSIVHLCSLVSADRRVRPLSTGWTQHFYWRPDFGVEINVWAAFQRKIEEYAKAIKEWEGFNIKTVKVAAVPEEVSKGRADLFVATADCADFMRILQHSKIKADYCFSDPPYNGMIQYGELSYMWNAWRVEHHDLDESMERFYHSEMTENYKQSKKKEDYFRHLRAAFYGMQKVLKDESFIHITYSSPKLRYRNMTLRAAKLAGLEFEKLHFQPPLRPSKKSIEKPFGSVFGDFIFRFKKPIEGDKSEQSVRTKTLSNIVEERTEYILKHRAESTPMPIVIAECERELYKCGYFDDDDCVLRDVEKEVKVNHKFIVSNKLVSFSNPEMFTETPLSMRVEKSIRNSLAQARIVTFTDVWRSILEEYPNSLTPDSTLIVRSLRKFASPREGGKWELKNGALCLGQTSLHDQLIFKCATLAIRSGFNCVVGAPELAKGSFSLLRKKLTSSSALFTRLQRLGLTPTLQQKKRTKNIDLLAWKETIDKKILIYAFEVETTTNFIDGFERFEYLGSCPEVDASLVIVAGDRMLGLQGKIATKTTFQSINKKLTKKTSVLAASSQEILGCSSWAGLKRKIDNAETWHAIQSRLELFKKD